MVSADQAVVTLVTYVRMCVCVYLGWRPAFKLYNAWVALFGAAICVAIMFVINWYFALITIVAVAMLYKIVDFLKPGT